MSRKRKRSHPRNKQTAAKAIESTVYGESATVLLSALAKANHDIGGDGMHHISVEMEPHEAPQVLRAMMRAEAELLLSDADKVKPHALDTRTSEQRQADALVAVLTAASKQAIAGTANHY